MVYCSNCGTANRDGSRFCNDCGAKLPSGTSVRCPQCGTPNSPSDSFCEKCGNRLVPTLADDAPEPEPSPAVPLKKGLSLPTKPDADASPSSGDWLGQLRSSIDPSTEGEATLSSTTESAADTSQSDWLARLTEYAADNSEPASPEDTLVSHAPAAPQPGAETGEVPDWLTSLGIIDNTPASADEEDAPEWLKQLPLNAAESAADSSSAADSAEPTAPADWLSALRTATPADSAASSDEDVPDWLRSLGTGPLASAQPDQPAAPAGPTQATASTADEDEIPDWLRTLGTGPLSSVPLEPQPAADRVPTDSSPATQPSTSEDMPDWLRGLGAADHTQRSTDELPDWLDSLGTEAAPTQPAGEESSGEDEVPAWLRELGANAETQPVEPVQSADDTSDWMSALRATSQEVEAAKPSTEEPTAEEVPDWLQSMGLPPVEQAPAAAVDETSDWMSALRATSQEEEATEPSTEEPVAEEVPDWLQAMGLQPAEPAPAAVDETSDWMSAFRATSQEVAATEPSTEEPVVEEVPDWLQSMGLPPAEPAPATADETSDWMSALRATSQEVAATEPSTEEPAAEEAPDWLQAVGLPPVEQAPAAADETSDWMSALRATSQEEEAAEPSTEEPAAEEVPDWLQSMGLPSAEQAPAAADETSDWMSALRVTSQEVEATEPSTEEPVAEEVPDWLQSMGLPPAEPVPATADDTSDWMSALRATSQEEEATESPSAEPAAEEVPDWLRDFNAPPARSGVVEPVEAVSGADDVPDWLRDVGPGTVEPAEKSEAGELPDWLQETSATEQEAVGTAEPATELPDWLSNLQPSMEATAPVSESAQPEAQPISPEPEAAGSRVEAPAFESVAVAAELPDWLKSLREGKAAAPVQPLEPVPGLTQAEIPSWLEALRPKEGQTTSVADVAAESEQEGIFAGLHNVLPPLPEPGEVPAAARMAAGPSADDLARAGIFQELLSRSVSRPTAVPALPTRGGQAGRRLLQWGVAVALLVVILVPFLMPQGWLPFLPQADNLPAAPLVQSAATTVKVLPPNASVLVVFDYDPAQAGEMDRIAEIMLRHLQTRAAKVTTVSLNPLGAGLASSVWASIGTPPSDHWTDLGYVPGQAVGVQSVLLNHGPFALVIDLSASADGLRWWVEQLTVSGFNMPFIAGVSAAVESLALPYVQSGQITGLISGATGAMMYGRQAELLPSLEEAQQAKAVADRTNQPPSAEVVLMVRNQYHIESQTLAHWLLAALIVIGLVSGLVSRAGRRSTP